MSDMYGIKTSTLTALGDAIRSKINGTTEIPILEVVNKGMTYNVSNRSFQLPDFVRKTKIVGSVDYPSYTGTSVPQSGLQGLGIAPEAYPSTSSARDDKNFMIINEGVGSGEATGQPTVNYNFDFEIIIESNQGTFACTKNDSTPGNFSLTYTAIGLDENGNEFKYTPLEMVDKINEMATIPDTALSLSGDISYRFRSNAYNFIIEQVGHKMTADKITSIGYTFSGSTELEEIPFDINCSTTQAHNVYEAFNKCYKLKNIPMINNLKPSSSGCSNVFADCRSIRSFPEGFGDNWNWQDINGASYGGLPYLFSNCYSLRQVPESIISNFWSQATSSYSASYYQTFYYCACLDEIHNLAVQPANLTSNLFSNTFNCTMRLKDMTFATNEDGAPQTATWKSQTIDLSKYVGYVDGGVSYTTGYNSGITADKQVTDDASYEALKNDPDWFTADVNYSRYNHDSAVNTINSLPDCSATGTNTIKFKGAAGALTDGGAINTLTDAEIAVAAAKGWTVTLV